MILIHHSIGYLDLQERDAPECKTGDKGEVVEEAKKIKLDKKITYKETFNKGETICQEVMGQGQWVRGREQVKVWGPGMVREKVEWADPLPLAPEEIVYAKIVNMQFRICPDSRVIKKYAPSAVRQ